MARRLWLHIGMHKTGSSSIQAAMRGYDDGRVAYLDWPDENHSQLMGCAFREANIELQIQRGFAKDEAEYLAVAEVLRARLSERLAATDRDIVISGEDMTAGMDAADVRRLVAFMGRFFDELRVIAYVRDVESYAASAFQEMQKVRRKQFNLLRLMPNYRVRFAPWEEVLGPAAVTYVPFAWQSLYQGDVVADFARRLGLSDLRLAVRRNESMSAEAAALIFVLWRMPWMDEARRGALVRDWVPRLEGFGRRKMVLSAAVVAELRRLAADDLAWMDARLKVPLDRHEGGHDRMVVRIGSEGGLWGLALRSALPLAVWLMWRRLRAVRRR